MTDETTTETTDETAVETPADTVAGDAADAPVETAETPATPTAPVASSGGTGGGSGGSGGVSGTPPIDIDAELTAKDALIDKFKEGVLTAEEYAAETAKIDKRILAAQRELAKPAQQVQAKVKEQEAAVAYWTNWGKGDDVAQKIGKTVKADRAAALYRDAMAEVAANPRYQGRKEFDTNSIAYDKWLDKLEAEAKKPATTTKAPVPPQTRVTGNAGVSQGISTGPRKTARQKLDDGEYNIGGE